MNREEIIRSALHEVAPQADLDGLDPSTDLRDALGLDSREFGRFVELLGERIGARIDEHDYQRLGSLLEIEAFLTAP